MKRLFKKLKEKWDSHHTTNLPQKVNQMEEEFVYPPIVLSRNYKKDLYGKVHKIFDEIKVKSNKYVSENTMSSRAATLVLTEDITSVSSYGGKINLEKNLIHVYSLSHIKDVIIHFYAHYILGKLHYHNLVFQELTKTLGAKSEITCTTLVVPKNNQYLLCCPKPNCVRSTTELRKNNSGVTKKCSKCRTEKVYLPVI